MTLSLGEMCHALFSRDPSDAAGNIFLYSRLPRAMASFLAGAALATAGAVLQTVLGNKLASPGIIGVNAGAGLGITICCACGVFSGWMASVSAFLGSLVVVLAIALFSRRSGVSRTTVILT
ncbi:MAG: iron chelate uptake ABC transporter family permease subunit, partial [Oscillospiraceae bacterium]|nr:iron chelate uptake ABC transporter family permease subunit [Oscillospiraceae bacterium]